MKIRKKTILWGVITLFLVGAGAKFLFFQPINVPKDFLDARQRSINIAQGIARLASDSLIDLSRIGQLDGAGKIKEALSLVTKSLNDNQQARAEAIKLSATLEVMAKNLPEISPYRARDLATEGLGYEVTLINHLITYNDYLNQLLSVLQEKFAGRGDGGVDAQIKKWINKINDEGEAINVLNRKYNDTMIKFDKVTSLK